MSGNARPPSPRLPLGAQRSLASASVGMAIAVWWGGFAGVAAGLAAAGLIQVFIRRLPDAQTARMHEQAAIDAPHIAAAAQAVLAAGGSQQDIAAVICEIAGAPLASALVRVRTRMAMGARPRDEWRQLASQMPALAPICDALAHADERGVTAAASLRATAGILLAEGRRRRSVRMKRVGIQSLAPLGLFALPAFMMATVVPLIAAYVSGLGIL